MTIASDVADLDEITQAIGAEAATVLGHSWGGLLAMEYAVSRSLLA